MALDAVSAFLHRKMLRRVRRRMVKGEQVDAVTPGQHDGQSGCLVLTNRAMYWVPKRGRIVIRPRSRMHDRRNGDRSGLVDSRQPSWQVEGAPAGAARTFATASKANAAGSENPSNERAKRLLETGRITQAEYDWMLQKR